MTGKLSRKLVLRCTNTLLLCFYHRIHLEFSHERLSYRSRSANPRRLKTPSQVSWERRTLFCRNLLLSRTFNTKTHAEKTWLAISEMLRLSIHVHVYEGVSVRFCESPHPAYVFIDFTFSTSVLWILGTGSRWLFSDENLKTKSPTWTWRTWRNHLHLKLLCVKCL